MIVLCCHLQDRVLNMRDSFPSKIEIVLQAVHRYPAIWNKSFQLLSSKFRSQETINDCIPCGRPSGPMKQFSAASGTITTSFAPPIPVSEVTVDSTSLPCDPTDVVAFRGASSFARDQRPRSQPQPSQSLRMRQCLDRPHPRPSE